MREALSIAAIFGLAAILLFVGIQHASDYPPPRPLEARNEPQAKFQRANEAADPNERATKRTPIFVQIVGAQDGAVITTQDKRQGGEKATTEWWTMAFTGGQALVGALAFLAAAVQVGLFFWQLGLMREGVNDANKAAKAAMDSAGATKEAVLTMRHGERAYVKASPVPPGARFTKNDAIAIGLEIKNLGRTPAHVTDVVLKAGPISSLDELPAEPDYSPVNPRITDAYLPAGDHFFHNGTWGPDTKVVPAVKEGKTGFIVYGYVDYIDAFGVRHRTGFARRYWHKLDDPNMFTSESDFKNRTNLMFLSKLGYTYDEEREPGEGRDWPANRQA